MLKDASFHMKIFGAFGGLKASIVYMIQLERMKKHCEELMLNDILNVVVIHFGIINHHLSKQIQSHNEQDQIFKNSSPQLLALTDILQEYKRNHSTDELCGIIFVQRRFTAKVLYHILFALRELPEFHFIKPQFVVGLQQQAYNNSRESTYVAKENTKNITAFCDKEVNLLIATNVLEEGIDVPDCTLIAKFHPPSNYQSYVQSKGRARARDKQGYYYMMVQSDQIDTFQKSYEEYQATRNTLNACLIGRNGSRLQPSTSAITEMYHTPHWYIKTVTDGKFQVVIQLPVKCPIRDKIWGQPMPYKKSAKRADALEACIRLHKSEELMDDLKIKSRSLPEEDTVYLFEN